MNENTLILQTLSYFYIQIHFYLLMVLLESKNWYRYSICVCCSGYNQGPGAKGDPGFPGPRGLPGRPVRKYLFKMYLVVVAVCFLQTVVNNHCIL